MFPLYTIEEGMTLLLWSMWWDIYSI